MWAAILLGFSRVFHLLAIIAIYVGLCGNFFLYQRQVLCNTYHTNAPPWLIRAFKHMCTFSLLPCYMLLLFIRSRTLLFLLLAIICTVY